MRKLIICIIFLAIAVILFKALGTSVNQVSMEPPSGITDYYRERFGVSSECVDIPEELTGKWGLHGGIYYTCGGIAGRCYVGRRKESLSFEVLNDGAFLKEGKKSDLCIQQGDVLPEALFSPDISQTYFTIKNDYLSITPSASDGFPEYYQRLKNEVRPALPDWAVHDWVVEQNGRRCAEGVCYLMLGANYKVVLGYTNKDDVKAEDYRWSEFAVREFDEFKTTINEETQCVNFETWPRSTLESDTAESLAKFNHKLCRDPENADAAILALSSDVKIWAWGAEFHREDFNEVHSENQPTASGEYQFLLKKVSDIPTSIDSFIYSEAMDYQ